MDTNVLQKKLVKDDKSKIRIYVMIFELNTNKIIN